jgi:hypothetical protein
MKYIIPKVFNSMLLFFLSLALVSGLAFAGGSEYPVDTTQSVQGGGTWGAILQLSLQVNGPTAHFFVSKKDGTFTLENKVQIRSGSYRGPVLSEGTIRRGIRTAEVLLDLDHRHTEDTKYYAYISNSYGHAWAGPVQMKEYNVNRRPEKRGSTRSNLSPALLNASPGQVRLHEHIYVPVTAGTCPHASAVQVRCHAEDSNWPVQRPYISGWIRPGSTVELPLIFSRLGHKRISCVTFDQCCSSPVSQRSIEVLPNNRPPQPPQINLSSSPREVHSVVLLSVLPGQDPDQDPVRVECTAEDSNRSADRPYLSGWFNVPRWTDAHFVFFRSGSKQVSCVTIDRKGQRSVPSTARIQVSDPKVLPPPSVNTLTPGKRIETKIEISVVTDADGTNSEIKVESSKSDLPYGKDMISFDRPYIPDYSGAQGYVDDFSFDPFEQAPGFPSSSWQQQLP